MKYVCANCKTEFNRKPSDKNIFCSRTCLGLSQRKGDIKSLSKELLEKQRRVNVLEEELRRVRSFSHLKEKADKYDTLLKKYQELLVDNKILADMMKDMRKAVENLMKPYKDLV